MATTLYSKGEGFETKQEADHAKLKVFNKQINTEVEFENRFGRKVIIREYEARKMVRRGEGKILKEIGPLRKRARDMKEEVTENKENIRVLGDQPIETVTTTNNEDTIVKDDSSVSLEDLKEKYFEKFGKRVPGVKSKDSEWILKKLGE